jgi:hypothetical protein
MRVRSRAFKLGNRLRILGIALVGLVVIAGFTLLSSVSRSEQGKLGGTTQANAASLPLYFVENVGQINGPANFYADARSFNAYLSSDSILYVQPTENEEGTGQWVTKMAFVGANNVIPTAAGSKDAHMSYFRGSPDDWKTGVRATSAVKYTNLWDGIDMLIEGSNGSLKYTFNVAPGADPGVIAMEYLGAEVKLENGSLIAEAPDHSYIDQAPTAFQPDGSSRRDVPAKFVLEDGKVRFALGKYDPSLPLVIDPIVITYASYLGGTGSDDSGEVQIDSAGNIYLAGRSRAADTFSGTGVSGFDPVYGGNGLYDGIVSKYSPDGASLLWGAYVGGTDEDNVFAMDIDADGNVYAGGTTHSNSTFQVPNEEFPATAGADDTTYAGITAQDAFVCKIDTEGLSLYYCTYFGGTDGDFVFDIAVDSEDRAYIAGLSASSPGEGFPALIGPDTSFNGPGAMDHDAFVARFNDTGSDLEYAGYIGGSGGLFGDFRSESIDGISVDGSFNAYVTGSTTSDETTFPDGNGFDAVPGFDQEHDGSWDGFIAKVDPTGATLLGATYIGGSGLDELTSNNLAASGDLVVQGETVSTEADGYPVAGNVDATHNGGIDSTLLVIDSDLTTAPSVSGFYGGNNNDFAGESCKSITTDADGNIYFVGWTDSTETSFPVLDGPDLTYNGGIQDGYMAKFTDAGELLFSGYIGGEGEDYACGVEIDDAGGVWTAMTTPSATTYPNGHGFYSIPGFDQTFGGDYDGGMVRVSQVPAGVTLVESGGSTNVNEAGPTSDDYTVVLESQPQFNVTVSISPNAQQTTDKSSLTFSPLNWDVPQQVVVTAVDDADRECPHDGLIAHAASSQDLNYNGIAVASVVPHITDNEVCDPTERITGGDPRDLSLKISQARFGDNEARVVLLAREDLWIDAFVGTPLSTITDGPLLLNPTDALAPEVLAEIDRVLSSRNQRVYVLGREDALSDQVVNDLATAGFSDIVRLGGADRDETAQKVAQELMLLNPTPVQQIFIAENIRLVDAMTVGAAAAKDSDGTVNPILLGDRTSTEVDPFTADFLRSEPGVTQAVLVGGEEALPAELEQALYEVRPNISLSRVSGADRYGTARAIADTYFSAPTGVVVAGGEQQSIAGARTVSAQVALQGMVGALLAAGLAGDRGWPLLITQPNQLPTTISSYLTGNRASITQAFIVGNDSDVSATVAATIQQLIQ